MSAPATLMAERLRLVLALGEANAAQHRAQAMAGGAEIEVMTLERDGAAAPASAALKDAYARDAAAQARLSEAAARVAALEAELAAIDAGLARSAT